MNFVSLKRLFYVCVLSTRAFADPCSGDNDSFGGGELESFATKVVQGANQGDHSSASLFPPPKEVQSIVDLQPFKISQTIENDHGDMAKLTNLNPNINRWYILEL